MIREERLVRADGAVEYRYFGDWRVTFHDGSVVEFRDVDLTPYGNRIPLPTCAPADAP